MKEILVATDGSPSSFKALDEGLRFARNFSGCRLYVLHVGAIGLLDIAQPHLPMGGDDVFPREVEERLTANAKAALAAALAYLGEVKDVEVVSESVLGQPADVICETAAERKSDLVVVGSRGLGKLQKLVLGSVSDYVVRNCACPVLVVKP